MSLTGHKDPYPPNLTHRHFRQKHHNAATSSAEPGLDYCRPATRDPLKSLLVTRLPGDRIRPAVELLRDVLAQVKQAYPEIHAIITLLNVCRPADVAGSQSIRIIASAYDGVQTQSARKTLAGLAATAPVFSTAARRRGAGF